MRLAEISPNDLVEHYEGSLARLRESDATMLEVIIGRDAMESGKRPSEILDPWYDLSEAERLLLDIRYHGAVAEMNRLSNEAQRILSEKKRSGQRMSADAEAIRRMDPEKYIAMKNAELQESLGRWE